MRHRQPCAACALLCALLFAMGADARSRSRVVVMESADAVPTAELVTALRVQLGRASPVTIQSAPPRLALGDRLAKASALVRGGSAVLVVWIERASGDDASHDDYIVYAVGRDQARALIEVVRIPADGRADTVRIMALKVASLVDVVLSTPTKSDVTRSFAEHSTQRGRLPARYAPMVEVGLATAGLGGDLGMQAGASFALGIQRSGGGGALSGYAGARWLGRVRATNALGEVDIEEAAFAMGARAGFRAGAFGVGLELSMGARVIDAGGIANDGRTETAVSVVPYLGVGLHTDLQLWRWLDLRLHVGVEAATLRQRFLLLGQPAADLGRFRGIAGLSLVWIKR